MPQCECEHQKHFPDEAQTKVHVYGANVENTYQVKTDYGTFNVCKPCQEDCLKKYANMAFQMRGAA